MLIKEFSTNDFNKNQNGFCKISQDKNIEILDIISNPNITYILMMLGLVGLYLELSSPGLILPGVIGGISLILALYAMQTLPVNYAGLLLIMLGVVLFITEVNVMSYGLLSVGGAISIFLGSIMLIDSDDPAMQISKAVLYPTLGMTFLRLEQSIWQINPASCEQQRELRVWLVKTVLLKQS